MDVAKAAASTVNSAADSLYDHTIGAVGSGLGYARKHVYEAHDRQVERAAKHVLGKIEAYLVRYLEDPYMPLFMKKTIRMAWDLVCKEVNVELLEEVMGVFGWCGGEIKAHRLDYWPGPPRLWYFGELPFGTAIRRLLYALRAKFLYAQMPADGSTWKVIREPLGCLILLAKLNPWLSVYTFALTFALMDRRDEYQLVRFILKFKAAAFVTDGIVPAVQLGLSYHACIIALGKGNPSFCVQNAPSASPTFPWALLRECLRLLLVYVALGILVSGHAVGGSEELEALEYARLDAADGSLDGEVLKDVVPTDKAYGSRQAYEARHYGRAEKEIDRHRAKAKVGSRTGGYVPYFVAFDACVLLLLLGVWAVLGIVQEQPLDPDDWSGSYWSSLYNLKLLYALCSLPWLLFQIPLLDEAMHEAKATGYDQSGQLVGRLFTSSRLAVYKSLHPNDPLYSPAGRSGGGAASAASATTSAVSAAAHASSAAAATLIQKTWRGELGKRAAAARSAFRSIFVPGGSAGSSHGSSTRPAQPQAATSPAAAPSSAEAAPPPSDQLTA